RRGWTMLLVCLITVAAALAVLWGSEDATRLRPVHGLALAGATQATITAYADRVAGYLPYSSLTFIVGLALGLLKG
ncbi:MAG: hypothetical protein JRN42_09305, partial [Nitrososphaerota archaeon]|nr:hypothetical protein [Nitrososphaerota archaeon]